MWVQESRSYIFTVFGSWRMGCSRLLQQQPSATSSQQQASSSEAASSKPSSRTAGAASSSREQPSDQLPNTELVYSFYGREVLFSNLH